MTRRSLQLAALLAALIPWTQAQAQIKPVAVLSIASVDKLIGDVQYVTQAAGMPHIGAIASTMAGQFLEGVDRQRPAGVLIMVEENTPKGVAFIPVANFQTILEKIETQFGEAEKAGNGILKFGFGQDVFVKEVGTWVYVTDNAAHLKNVPANPATLLGGLHTRYEIALRINVQNVPRQLRDVAVQQIKVLAESGAFDNPGVDEELSKQLAENSVKSLTMLVQETEQLTLGWSVDTNTQRTFLDFSMVAAPGTEMAKQMQLLQQTSSRFSGFMMPNAAATFSLASGMSQPDIDRTRAMLKVARKKGLEAIDGEDQLPGHARQGFKQVMSKLLDVIDQTVADGKMDMGAAMVLEPKAVRFAAGGLVADGKVVEDAFKQLVDLTKDQPDVPEVKFNVASHAGVNFHALAVPVPAHEEEARRVLGDTLHVVLGTGPQSLYVAFGKDCQALLEQIIDASSQAAETRGAPMRMSIALAPLLKFLASVEDDENLAALAGASQQQAGKDHILMTATPIQRGVSYRIEAEEGVLNIIGTAARLRGADQGF